jgi:hypothetical protein
MSALESVAYRRRRTRRYRSAVIRCLTRRWIDRAVVWTDARAVIHREKPCALSQPRVCRSGRCRASAISIVAVAVLSVTASWAAASERPSPRIPYADSSVMIGIGAVAAVIGERIGGVAFGGTLTYKLLPIQ